MPSLTTLVEVRVHRVIAAFCFFASTVSATAQAAPEDLKLGRVVRAHYERAWTNLESRIDTTDTQFHLLLALTEFKRQHVAWAVERNGRMFAVLPSRARAWLTVVPVDDSAHARMGSIMEADRGASLPSVRVKPDTIAPAWAAVFLSFELSFLADQVLELVPRDAGDEDMQAAIVRAYRMEYLAARATGGPAFVAHLDSIIAAVAPTDVVSFSSRILVPMRAQFDALDAHFGKQRALTRREEQRRLGALVVALLLRYDESNPTTNAVLWRAIQGIGG